VLNQVNLNFTGKMSISGAGHERIHNIKPVVEKFKASYGFTKGADKLYQFGAKKYASVTNTG